MRVERNCESCPIHCFRVGELKRIDVELAIGMYISLQSGSNNRSYIT